MLHRSAPLRSFDRPSCRRERRPRGSGRLRARPALALGCAIVIGFGVVPDLAGPADPAAAASYPSWADVLAARGSERKTGERVGQLRGLLGGLRTSAKAASAEADRLGSAFATAQQSADEAALDLARLRKQAADQQRIAEVSGERAGSLAAQTARVGGHDLAATLMADASDADDLLLRLGSLTKLTERSSGVSDAATRDARTARSLSAQATRAERALADRAAAAERAMAVAQAASDRAEAAVQRQEENEARLQAQLATLTSGRQRTEAEFRKGEAVRRAAEAAARRAAAEAARKAAQLAAQQAAAAAAANRPGGGSGSGGSGAPGSGGSGSGGSGGGGGGTRPNPGGGSGGGGGGAWIRPAGGGITSVYGMRKNPVTGVWTNHDGVDLGSGCSTAIVAASAGTVTYVGRFGGYGNYVKIDHGAGVATAYGHIVDGGFRVRVGDRVAAGTLVALVGSTGNSTGCHLHYETRLSSVPTDPIPFMAARGVFF